MTRPAPLARNLGWAARQLLRTARQLAGQERKPPGRPSHKRRPRRRPNPDRPDADACRLGRDATTDARSPSRAAEPARPSRSRRAKREVRQPERENLGVDGGASRNSFIAAALAPAAAASGVSASATMSRKASASPSKLVSSGSPTRSAAMRRVGRRAALGGTRTGATADGCARRGWWARPAGVGRKMFGVAQRGRVLAMARQGGAGGRRRARPGADAARRRTADWGAEFGRARRGPAPAKKAASAPARRLFGGRAQDGNACSNSGLGGAEPARRRRDRRAAVDRRRAARIGGGVSSSKRSAGSNRTMALA